MPLISIRRLLTALVWGAIATIAAARADAFPPSSVLGDGQHLDGSWIVDATVEGEPPLKGLITFTRDGALVENVPLPFVSAGHGAWVRTGDRRFAITNVYLVSDASGQLLRIGTVHGTYALDRTLTTAAVAFHVDLSDPDGQFLSSFDGSGHAARIVAEP
jgi:hypothetical protein